MDEAMSPDYRRLFEEAPCLFLVLDPDLRVVAASNAYLEATLTTRASILGRHIFDIFPDNPEDPNADSVRNSRASFHRVLQTRMPDTIGLQRHDVRRPDSEGGGFEVRYWSAVNYPILNPDGSLAYVMHKVENATEFIQLKQQGVEQAKMTDEFRQLALKMEADLYSRSREMAEASQKLKDANEELEGLYRKTRELDELKSHFFANVSHELRTPLTLILGPVRKLLTADNLDPKQRGDLAVVERNARLLLKNVNDLLDLSKLDAGRMEVEYLRTDLVWLTRYVAAHFETIADENQIRFSVQTPDALSAEVDPPKLQRALFNLVANAFKFTPAHGEVRLRLSTEGSQAVFEVEDTGPGIQPEMRQAVFERFRQIDSGPARGHGGSGLGLAIVREFVNLHLGSVEVTEAAGGGARFVMAVPLTAPEGSTVKAVGYLPEEGLNMASLAAAHEAKRGAAGTVPSDDAPLVLVVEDNPEMNSFIHSLLQDPYRVVSAFDGQEGLEKTLKLRPDLIITDFMMPRMTGEEMIAEIRLHREFDDVPILLLTAKVDEKLRVQLLTKGVQDALVKPFLAEELLARSAGLIARKTKVEAALRESYALLKAVTEGINEAIFIKDAQGRYQMVNSAGAQRLGRLVEEVVGSDDAALFDVAVAAQIRMQDQRVLGSGEMLTFEEQRVVQGAVRTFLTTKAPHRDPLGRVIGVLGISRDITERKQAEVELQKAKDSLEERVRERTEELRRALQELRTETEERMHAVEELQVRERMLMQQSRLAAMGEMLVNISHQWRQPLNVVSLLLQSLSRSYHRGNFSRELLEQNVGRANELIDHMSKTINDFTAYLNPDKMKQSFDLKEVVAKAVAMVGETLRDVVVEVESAEDAVQALGYRNEYAQVLINILINARDAFRERGTAAPVLKLSIFSEGGKSVVTVADNAGGIAPEILDKIFEPYFTTKAPDRGTGIGLFMSKNIIEKNMGGTLTVRNTAQGAEFRIEV